ncbi:MAG TPA: c-type cytochrome [Candidatus Binataceae bacterium]|nr:c-type cytochrome [Candidatus Binataceae bacterium]
MKKLAATLGFCATVMLTEVAPAQMTPPATVATGRRLFHSYCAPCHGDDAKGNGPMASFSAEQVADLTALRRRYHGAIPFGKIWDMLPDQCSEACPNKPQQVRDIQSFLATLQK